MIPRAFLRNSASGIGRDAVQPSDAIRSAAAASLVVNMPPSPVVGFLVA